MSTREQPSPFYRPRLDMLKQLTKDGFELQGPEGAKKVPGDKVFTGLELLQYVAPIKEFIKDYQASSLLEYGCGRGDQYKPFGEDNKSSFEDVKSYWNLKNVACYDSTFKNDNNVLDKSYDGVVCVNYLQFYNIEDLSWLVRDLFSHAEKFVFINVPCYPLAVQLPEKMVFHATVRNPTWWAGFIAAIANDFPDVDYRLGTISVGAGSDGTQKPQQNWTGRISKRA